MAEGEESEMISVRRHWFGKQVLFDLVPSGTRVNLRG